MGVCRRRDMHHIRSGTLQHAFQASFRQGNVEARGGLIGEIGMHVADGNDLGTVNPSQLRKMRVGNLPAAQQCDSNGWKVMFHKL